MAEKTKRKKTLGICIPYFRNTEQCEIAFKKMMEQVEKEITDDMLLCVYEDGQVSDWLVEYQKKLGDKMFLIQNPVNYGVSYARNRILDYLVDKTLYVLFIDSDDDIDDNYLKVMHDYCGDNSHEVIEGGILINDVKTSFEKNIVRCGAAGSAIQSRLLKNKRFDESLQIGEDTRFMGEVIDLTKHRKKYADTNYYYKLGNNPESLTMRWDKKTISKYR